MLSLTHARSDAHLEFSMSLIRITLALAASLAVASAIAGDNWTRFRGNDGQGLSADTVPTEWNGVEDVSWKSDLPGKGSSSPIVVGGKVFLTCFTGNSDPDAQRHLVCIDAISGEKLWTRSVDVATRDDAYSGFLTEHGYSSATPVSDGKNVYAFYGKTGVWAYTVDGEELWHVDVGQMSSNRRWGSAASPVLFGDVLIVNASEEDRAIVGLDTKDGSTKWRAPYELLELCYSTPVLVEGEGGVTEAVFSMPGEVWGLNPTNGKLRWYCEIDNGGNVSPSVVVSEKAFYTFGGYPQQQTNAIKRGGRKDISQSHRVWNSRDSSYVATPLLDDGKLQWVSDRGQVFVVDAESGETLVQSRLRGVASGGRPFYASPVKAGDHIYVVSRHSGTYVFKADGKMTQVVQNPPLDESDFNATPAIVDGRMYIRSDEALYCIE